MLDHLHIHVCDLGTSEVGWVAVEPRTYWGDFHPSQLFKRSVNRIGGRFHCSKMAVYLAICLQARGNKNPPLILMLTEAVVAPHLL